MLVIIVEDDFTTRDLLTRIIAAEQHQVMHFSDSITALNFLQTNPTIGIMLIDMQLPGGPNGLSLAKQARLLLPRCAILMMSSYAEREDILEALYIDADDFIFKPIDPVRLPDRLSGAVMRRLARSIQYIPDKRELGPLIVNLISREITWLGNAIHLTRTEFTILAHLTVQPGSVLNYAHLCSLLTGEHLLPSVARIKMKTHIQNLRGKLLLPDGYSSPIRVLKGQGIKWDASVYTEKSL